ncbi:MAG: hypothetical protein P3W93_003720 [Thermus sp.]|nr:hypothetical protein [Thermus sp.]
MRRKTRREVLQGVAAAAKLVLAYAQGGEEALRRSEALGVPVPEGEGEIEELERLLALLRDAYARLGALEGRWRLQFEDNSAEALRKEYGL